ncbi:MAG: DUF370 domain-containing protein [Ruminococcaceae bacterium]|nr:DUF370 domain-containing protein [Oscillospiraceae bacterium]
MKLINVGFNNMICADKVVALVSFDSAPSKRLVQDSKDNGRAIDCTGGKKTRSVIVTDSGHVILSSLETEKIAKRVSDEETEDEDE